ncbi:hypothetical protein N9164_09865 [Draconibacterium sp.]|nr:hypothetical protein [Draconibacterium sp.]
MKNHNKVVPQFSYYKAPVTNTKPYQVVTLKQVHEVITGNYFINHTNQLRLIADKSKNREYKASQFHYVTFSGVFSKRNEKALIEHSGLMALDFDHIEDVMELKKRLLADPYLNTELLFISPNGNGIKWIVSAELTENLNHGQMFQALYNYIKDTYSIEVDKACKDVSRATFLCYDPEAYIRPKHLVQ